jgi:sulfatase maturation enzyme AslB (radical SAM superfamily)
MEGIVSAWGRILRGIKPVLSVEITRECPLRCPGCYAYSENHLGGEVTLRSLADFKGQELVDRMKALVVRHDPLHVSIVGGEPLVRYRELGELLPWMSARGLHVQVVTSAVRPIPLEWAGLRRLRVTVSIDGLQPNHDARRAPATYDRILKHIAGHQVTVHSTLTHQQLRDEGGLETFAAFWSSQEAVEQIWLSFYTPQVGERSEETLTPEERRRAAEEIVSLGRRYPKVEGSRFLLAGYLTPPSSPAECVFARTTRCVSADFETPVTPCQIGGTPDCSQCGCLASVGLAAVTRYTLPGGFTLSGILRWSEAVGRVVGRATGRDRRDRRAALPAPPGRVIPVRQV